VFITVWIATRFVGIEYNHLTYIYSFIAIVIVIR